MRKYIIGSIIGGITMVAGVAYAANPVTFPVNGGSGWGLPGGIQAHTVILGNGTSPYATTSPSTAGFVLTSNGVSADPTFQASTGGSSFSYPFPGNATTTTITFSNGIVANASTTITQLHMPLAAGGLAINGGLVYSTATTTFSSPLIYASNNVTCQTATGSVPGCLSAADWTTFNGKGNGTVTSVDVSGGTTGLTTSGGPITTNGSITLAGTLNVANGGTGKTSFPANSFLTSDAAGTAIIATTSSITITSLLATSTTATSTFAFGVKARAFNATATSTFAGLVSQTGGFTITTLPSCGILTTDTSGNIVCGTVGGGGTVTSITAGDGLLGGTITTSGTIYGQVGTSTTPVLGQIPYWAALGTATSPAKLTSVATTTLGGSGAISVSNSPYVIGASGAVVTCANAAAGTTGCLLGVDFSRFNSATTTFSAPLTYTLGTNAVTIAPATNSVNGYLTAVDHSLFASATTTFTSPLIYTLGTNAVTCQTASASQPGCESAASFSKFNSATTTFSTGLTYTLGTNAVTVNTSQNIATLSNLSTNGLVTTSGSNGTLGVTVNSTGGFVLAMANGIPTWVASTTYASPLAFANNQVTCATCLTANQTITLTGAVTGSGSTAITTAFGTAAPNTVLSNITGATAVPTFNATSTLYTGTAGQNAYFSSTGGLVGTSTIFTTTAGRVGIGTLTPNDTSTNSFLTVAGPGFRVIAASSTDNTTSSAAIIETYAPGTAGYVKSYLGSHASNQVTSRFGLTLGGWVELAATSTATGGLNGFVIGTVNPAPIVFGTNNLERLRITDQGAVGLGLTTPGSSLEIKATSTAATGNAFITWDSSNNNLFDIRNDGRVGIGTSSPSINVQVAANAANNATIGIMTTDKAFYSSSNVLIGSIKAGDGTYVEPQIWMGQYALSPSFTNFIFNLDDNGSGGTIFNAPGSNNMSFRLNNVDAMKILGSNSFLGIASSTPGSLFSFGGSGTGVNFFDNGTTTFSGKGINLLKGGCFAIQGTCVGGSSVSAVGGTGAVQFANGTAFNGNIAQLFFDTTNIRLGIGTSTPHAVLSANSGGTLNQQNLIEASYSTGSTDAATTTVFTVASSSVPGLGIGTTTPFATLSIVAGSSTPSTSLPSNAVVMISAIINAVTYIFEEIDQWGHIITSGTPPVLSSCGTSPSFIGAANDNDFSIQVGSVAATACTATFSHTWGAAPTCVVTERTGSVANTFSYTVSTSAIVVSQTGLTSDIIDVHCRGTQ